MFCEVNMKFAYKFSILVILSVLLVSNVFASGSSETGTSEDSFAGIVFTCRDINGNTIDSENLFKSAKITMVNVWATYCSPCIREMPALGELYRDMRSEGVEIIGVISDAPENLDEDNLNILRDFQSIVGVEFPFVLPSQSLVNSLLSDVSVVPTTFFIDNKGKIVKTVIGSKDHSSWKSIVEDVLKSTN